MAASKKPFPPGMPIAEGEVIAGKYRVEGLVAVGGMGVVVSASHLQLGQQVAIKVLLPVEADDETQAIPRFLREARAAAGLKSEHVVRIYDVDTLSSGLPYMVMELLTGQDLRRVVKTRGPVPTEEAVDYVLQAADAIGEAHESGIVHRDLKPSNLFLAQRNDGRPWVKVLDFGISKASHDPALDAALTTSRVMIGSPMYMSPEQVRDAKSVDGRSDIWSLGVILHELLTGRSAFKGESLPAICAAIAADPPASLRAARPDISPELEAIITCCLQKDPARRYQTVDELRGALQPFLGEYSATLWGAGSEPGRQPGSTSRRRAPRAPASARLPLGSSDSIDVDAKLVSTVLTPDPSRGASTAVKWQQSDPEERTLQFSDVATTAASAKDRAGEAAALASAAVPPARRRGGVLLVVGLVLVAAMVGFALLTRRAPADTSKLADTRAEPASFSLTLESNPSGADVTEGDRVLGRTPLSFSIERQTVAGRPRVFSLQLSEYERYEVSQGDAAADVKVRAELVRRSVPAGASAVAGVPPSAAPSPRTRERAAGKTSLPHPPSTAAKPGTDIRLTR